MGSGGGANNKGIWWQAWVQITYPKGLRGMGFRDLSTFNLAMIAKQGWNFMTKSHSLVARIYKARWSIGDRTSIKVMSESWLRDKDDDWVPSPQTQGAYNIMVGDLMNGEWMLQPIKMVGKRFGKFTCRPRLRIFYGVFARDVYQPVYSCKSGMSRVNCRVQFVTIATRMNDIPYVNVKIANKQALSQLVEQFEGAGDNLGFKAKMMWEDWNTVNQLQQHNRFAKQQQQVHTWQKPSMDSFKCNVDAGFQKDLNRTNSGWIL
ncbi:hypothetical protein TSUD_57570 [Trifolium subterraneum]|uniref:Uncharacterized protein n=1 Tax=Trifolium subterraneum TaxID=3900 RepID=A0A2Z6MCC0_TRISU|nr:hypothetical protein TSUD_57570 [Trifolium subterraneum]